jgi:hypothetical protein
MGVAAASQRPWQVLCETRGCLACWHCVPLLCSDAWKGLLRFCSFNSRCRLSPCIEVRCFGALWAALPCCGAVSRLLPKWPEGWEARPFH